MAVKDILLLSNRLAKVVGEKGAAPKNSTCCSNRDDTSSNIKIVLEARERAIKKVMYYAACTEHRSEHPIAKGKPRGTSPCTFLRFSLTSFSRSISIPSNSCKGSRLEYCRGRRISY